MLSYLERGIVSLYIDFSIALKHDCKNLFIHSSHVWQTNSAFPLWNFSVHYCHNCLCTKNTKSNIAEDNLLIFMQINWINNYLQNCAEAILNCSVGKFDTVCLSLLKLLSLHLWVSVKCLIFLWYVILTLNYQLD